MERDKAGFNFRLLVPPRANAGQVSAVKPRDVFDKGYSKCFEETSLPFANSGLPVTLPTKTNKPDISRKMAVMPMEKEETLAKPSQLYSKLFEEAEKIKCWKSKLDSDISQKERKLHENKRTIETQRKAIQELQFENESLSMKLEEQMSENTDLTNKNNATRNLCNILKDTFERSAEKMSQLEAEQVETQHLFIQNNENIQRMVDAFEGLRVQAENDQQEMLRVKYGLKQFEHLKETFEKEFSLKEEEVVGLQTKLGNKENELKEISVTLQETQVKCHQLGEAEAVCQEELQTIRQKQDALREKLQETEVLLKGSEEKVSASTSTLEQTREEYEKRISEKLAKIQDMLIIQNDQAKQLSELQQTTQTLQESVAAEKLRVEELEGKESLVSAELKQRTAELGKITEEKEEADKQIHCLEASLEESSMSVVTLEKQVEAKEANISELTTEIGKMNDEIIQLQCKVTKVSDECEDVKTSLEKAINEEKNLKDMTQTLEAKLKECEEQLSAAQRQEEESEKEMNKLKKDIEQHKKDCERLTVDLNQLMMEKNTIQQEMEGNTSETKALEGFLKESKENVEKMKNEILHLEEENEKVREDLNTLRTEFEDQCQQKEDLQKQLNECSKSSQNESSKKDKQAKALELKLNTLTTKLDNKTKAHEEIQKENKALLKQINASKEDNAQLQTENKALLKQISGSKEDNAQLQTKINELKEKAQKAQRCHKEELEKVSSDLGSKTDMEAELREEVGRLKEAATEALKNKEDTEIKCQHKISDMVALMDKHKNQYDKMVMEKDSELEERMKKSMEMKTNTTKLELELSQLKIENDHTKQQLNMEKKETERLHQEVEQLKTTLRSQKKDHEQIEESLEKDISELKKQMKSLAKESEMMPEPKEPELVRKVQRGLSTPKVCSVKRSQFPLKGDDEDPFFATPSRQKGLDVFDIPKKSNKEYVIKTPCRTPASKVGSTPKIKTNSKDVFQTPSRTPTSKCASTPQIKAFRIRTPPSTEKWQKATLELDPKSDASDGADPMDFPVELEDVTPRRSAAQLRQTAAEDKTTPSPGVQKQAAMKRMRAAGWTTSGTLNRKKKKDSDDIFA
ncbi:synaptonemal complex protein 1 [Engraulis encrasicolus]|uniref:synaptonemal complex protein 1 n=1 Tax=Engraulis encrasicolus TaxID=184585 RepID=UPI002FD4B46D